MSKSDQVVFVDRVNVHFKAGNGGNGCASIRREKYRPLAGPNGGSGGNGGSILLKASSQYTSLLDYHFAKKRSASNGEIGYGGSKDGKRGDDMILPVPLGTVLKTRDGQFITELTEEGQDFLVVEGGRGGLGNESVASKQRKAPGFALLGLPGEEADLVLELKMLADVALVGFPSSGKSSIIAAISKARPKIADYPFTTLIPNLGVVQSDGLRFTVADVPGLIEGASEGKGLGHRFLRHIERTKIIVHVIDMATYEPGRDPICDLETIEKELAVYDQEVSESDDSLQTRPKLVVLNKVDDYGAEELAELVQEQLSQKGYESLLISASTHQGLDQMTRRLAQMLRSLEAAQNQDLDEALETSENTETSHNYVTTEDSTDRVAVNLTPLKRKNHIHGKHQDFTVEKKSDQTGEFWLVEGEKPRQWVLQTDMANDEAVGYLADRLAKLGIEDVLAKMGAESHDEVRISLLSQRVDYLTQDNEAYIFEFDPEMSAGAEILYSARRGEDLRLDYQDRVHRSTRKEKRDAFHQRQDERAKTREQFEMEREAGFWSTPSEEDIG